jgi:Fe2+ or Zn2+ uptake regulation protein
MSGRKLTNKQLIVLGVVRRNPQGLSVNRIAGLVTEEGVPGPCNSCDATGQRLYGRDCWRCKGTGESTPYFQYSDAYQALKRLRSEGLVTRTCKRDQFGDELRCTCISRPLSLTQPTL